MGDQMSSCGYPLYLIIYVSMKIEKFFKLAIIINQEQNLFTKSYPNDWTWVMTNNQIQWIEMTHSIQNQISEFWPKDLNSLSTYIFEVSTELSNRVHQGHGVAREAFLSGLFRPRASTCLCLKVSYLILQLHKNLKIHVNKW